MSRPLPNDHKSRKKAVIRRDGLRCNWCGTNKGLELDHKTPRSKGGSDDLVNLWLLCGPKANGCHGKKTRLDRKAP